MSSPSEPLARIVRSTRLLFHRLRASADRLHADLEITSPMRGVLESLRRGGPQTVPALAAARPVSRQHIQVQVDALADRGLVERLPNPAHRRSPLIALTAEGRALFDTILAREAGLLARIGARHDPGALETTARTLEALAEEFAELAETLDDRAGRD